MLRAYDTTARYVDQGGNKRPGAFAIYIEPWHDDIFESIDLRKNHGKEEAPCQGLVLCSVDSGSLVSPISFFICICRH